MDIEVFLKKIKNRTKKIISNPSMVYYYAESRNNKENMYQAYSEKSEVWGVDALYFAISFDCDTDKDIEVIGGIADRLQALNIDPVMAVPGELLKRGASEYKALLEQGAEFINHGYKTHSIKSETGYESVFDYYNIPLEAVEEDILKGDLTIKEVLGVDPVGFRTPHFGNFQGRRQLKHLWTILRRLDYKYSSSTIPFFAYTNGACFERNGIMEIPVTGLISEPLRIFDSFLFFDNENNCFDGERYAAEGIALADFWKQNVKTGLINIYVDPSQVYDSEGFFQVLEELNGIAENTTYSALMEKIK